ncbi:hypothetical protein EPZ47_09165 [Pseudomonas viciae]|uniref:Uncharacterized protein n=1 Tax=Pseudomonas viciae TaxID=2505979 RepID=A0A4P7PP94_9PSED|nr:hypothetical protein EPZ47_09165 [Pseudomonas viciae]
MGGTADCTNGGGIYCTESKRVAR